MTFRFPKLKLWQTLAGGAIALATGIWWFSAGDATTSSVPTYTVQRGPLQVNVLQGGEVRALHNFEVKSEIETSTKIITLIPEGYLITEKDIQEGKVLVELDNTEIKNRIQDQDIDFQTTVSAYIDADEGREIQRSENQSLMREMQQTALFALMDFEKYLGKKVAAQVLAEVNLPQDATAFDSFAGNLEEKAEAKRVVIDPIAPGEPIADSPKTKETEAVAAAKPEIAGSERQDFTAYLSAESNDGEAQQKLRQLEDELLLHKSEVALAKQKVEASERLAAKDFISKSQLENDQVSLEKVVLSVKTAETALDLFKRYEFPRQCEQYLSAYREVLNKLQRTVRANRSKMAQVESRYQTAKRRYDMQLARKEDLERQLKACTIRATQPGLVAYGDISATYRSYSDAIEEGSTVRLRQTILTIPDMTQMGVHVNVHESQVKKVKVGQPVLVKVDAEPGKVLEGRVAELAVLPDSASSRYTPTLKVYPCSIHITGSYAWLKPGMNAKVEIMIDQLADVLFVPVQSIEVEEDVHFCYIENGSHLERREIVTGVFNDEFIEVRSGVEDGEAVALTVPKRGALDSGPTAPRPPGSGKPAAVPEVAAKGKSVAVR
ncbi:MAG: efflux RND transporter periplasmic adaptor subunit [Verrucomicrobiales bacterium]|nr:efflux RND transporter periplasmic adaptor subunit [Verrucomicrobiales bacterium]MCP5556908.1 efflux RND transporter periplasmic adaptor subunit [Verrucomicrobiaceae bacterium]